MRHAADVDDAWWREPGASVQGHGGGVRTRGPQAQASCDCGAALSAQPSVPAACLTLLLHLQAAVRDGALVVGRGGGEDDGGGLAGVREPRRPVPSPGSGSVRLDPG